MAVREQPRFYRIKGVGAISALMVAKGHRRQGIATRLLAETGSFFRQREVKYYTFHTAVANQAAIRLYAQNGMEALHTSFIGET